MSTFPRVGRLSRGYATGQVDTFFAEARQAYERRGGRVPAGADGERAGEGPPSTGLPAARGDAPLDLTAQEVRAASFDLARHGYAVDAVDGALARLEDAVARHEREVAVARGGRDAFLGDLAARAGLVTGRVRRPDGARFSRARGLHRGYDVGEVDALCHRLRAYFDEGAALAVDDVRGALFRSRRGRRAYCEAPVDALLARAVEVMVTAPD
ncbi:DivIVA domain-containing protein [uncultured Pseudokineococcus sp.]|uniref:DivIVA domain-containing protein n=1 Tax=uncultured Pseudokineococcus sp. TaxID=1642928 RepID=UPI002608549A|nr:DivIVA domain-containing protein [uncultured Pseudokineococcus sp.]